MTGQAPGREVRFTLAGVFMGLFLAALDQTLVATALPRIVHELQGHGWYAWVGVIYLLGSTVAAPVAGRLVEIFPRKAVLVGALLLFGAGSALCGAAPTFTGLLAFRFLQGVGGGALFSLTFTTLAWFFSPRERSRWAGVVGALFGLASAVGPVVGGYFAEHLSWRWAFWVNLPFLALALLFVVRYMPHQPPPVSAPMDWGGVLLLVGWVFPLLLAFSCWGPERIAPTWVGGLLLGVALLMAVWWVRLERQRSDPLFDLSLFRLRTFRYAALAGFFFGPIFLGGVTFFPLYLQGVLGYSPSESGVLLLAFTVGAVGSTGAVGAWVSRHGRFKPVLVGSALLLGLLLAVAALTLPATFSLGPLLSIMVVGGVLLGPFQALLSVVGQNDAPVQRIGSVTSAIQFARQVGSTIGLAFLNTLFLMGKGLGGHLLPGLKAVFGGSAVLGVFLLAALAALPNVRLRSERIPASQ
ncbi:MAG: hypothetical protein KatS3mg026_0047 [Bacteroidia bacterium]|nr:MAG: hypothetical protein KatS3mg026_0047 [Bacteroidia bacterium]